MLSIARPVIDGDGTSSLIRFSTGTFSSDKTSHAKDLILTLKKYSNALAGLERENIYSNRLSQ